ncbi:hypothetical protein C8P66_10523 [Humitalea rosea]|uniref:Glycosyltransferase n=1 Tax=Humitalea rosea TaxID=990373 RepID=A0A2W7J8T5_9PROT|nr:TIGR04282 family arsenosugar biosynthesis glycosyltransferase [Humitalea rosea]PZW48276.1 hypothetical protein C8P66_10523 [Humitalea rosea]
MADHRPLLLIFARAPRLGTVKRRLARGIGDRAALRFHTGQLEALLAATLRDRRWRVAICGTPDHARFRLRRRVAVVPQGRGDLGDRLHRMTQGHRRVVVVGADIPGIGAADIATAFQALGQADAVFGPAEDGGYWLVGLGPRRPGRPFGAVRWGGEHALGDTLANFAGRQVALLRILRDVDTVEDLRAIAG